MKDRAIWISLVAVALLFALNVAVNIKQQRVVQAQTGYSPELSEIDINGVKVVPKNGKINIMTFDPTQVVVEGNNIIMRNYNAPVTQKITGSQNTKSTPAPLVVPAH